MPSARLLWMMWVPSVLSLGFSGKCVPQPGAKQSAKRDTGCSQDDLFIWMQKKRSTAYSSALKHLYHCTAFGGLLNRVSKGPHVLESQDKPDKCKHNYFPLLFFISCHFGSSQQHGRELSLAILYYKLEK